MNQIVLVLVLVLVLETKRTNRGGGRERGRGRRDGSWKDIGTIKTSEDSAEFRDLNAAQHSHRFYRLKQIY